MSKVSSPRQRGMAPSSCSDNPRADSWAHHGLLTICTHPGEQKKAMTSLASLIHVEAHKAGRAAGRWLGHCRGLGRPRRWWGAAGETWLEVAIAVQDTAMCDGEGCCGWWDAAGGYGGDV